MNVNVLELIRKDCKSYLEALALKEEKHETHDLIPGLEVCQQCTKGNFISTTRQTRSADEGMTLIKVCNYCGYKK